MFVDRDQEGAIIGRFLVQQRPNQEEIADDAAEVRLLDAKAAVRAEINGAFGDALAAGLSFGGKIIQIDDAGRANIAAAAIRAIGVALVIPGMSWPEDFYWRTADNSPLELTAVEMLAMGQAGADRFSTLIYRRGALKDAVEAATTIEEIEAIDVAAGWD